MQKKDLKTHRLRKLLEGRDRELYNRYELLWKFVLDNYLKFQNIENFTDHGKNHVLNIEKNINDLITKEAGKKLTPFDLFCLLSACCLHDIGMIQNRIDHHKITREILKKDHDKFHLNQQEAEIIGQICYSHGIPDLDELVPYDNWSVAPHGKVNTLLLAALLRIGDILDLSFLRAPKLAAELKRIKGISLYHWDLHEKVSNIEINPENTEITIFGKASNEYDLSKLHGLRNLVESEINIVEEIFRENGINFEKISLRTNLDKQKVLSKQNPFIRLAPFEWSQHVAFFGRDKEINDMEKKMSSGKLLVLAGVSGVGKTSLLNAGLKQRLIENETYVFNIMIAEDFEANLLKNLKTHLPEFKSDDLFGLLEEISSEGFKAAIFIDQFEELFAVSENQKIKPRMVSFLKKILHNEKISTQVVLGLREDFLAHLWEVSQQVPELYDREKTYRLNKLQIENARQAIVNTIKHVKYNIDSALLDELLDDFTKEETVIYPPYIQIVCYEIFENHKETYKSKSEETAINLAIYEKLGRSEKIVSGYFEEILDRFNYEERTVLNEILARMVTFFQTKQRISYEQIKEINNGRVEIQKTLDRLIKLRLINKIETEVDDEYELIHDFLARKIMGIKRSVGVSSKIKKVVEYIEDNFEKQISLQDVANEVDFSKEHLSRLFKVEMKENFIDYLNKRRIKEAKRYIEKNPGIKINEIFQNVGFTNPQHFTKIFKKVAGYTPVGYKKKSFERSN